jgi:hypothetical protein
VKSYNEQYDFKPLPPVHAPVNYVTGNTQCECTLTKIQGLLEVTPWPPASDTVFLYKVVTVGGIWGRRGVALFNCNHDSRQRWVVSFTHQLVYCQGKWNPTHQIGSRKGVVVKITMTYKGRVPNVVKRVDRIWSPERKGGLSGESPLPSHRTLCLVKGREPPNRPRRTHRVSGGIAQLFLNLSTRRGCLVSITPRPPLPPGKTRYPLYRRLGGPRSRSG